MTKLKYTPTHYNETCFIERVGTSVTLLFKEIALDKAGRVVSRIRAETFPNEEYMLHFIDKNNMIPLSKEEWFMKDINNLKL